MTPTAALIVPCYNEAKRLDTESWLELLTSDSALRLVFVNDGSTDETVDVLHGMRRQVPGDELLVVDLRKNQGKAEAVRQGLLSSLDEMQIVGYADADLATPPAELLRLLSVIREQSSIRAVIGARVALAGRRIERNIWRHYLGRVFSTFASLTLRQRIYDTQCGAKFFRADPALHAALRDPFLSRWAFDVELLGRLFIGDPSAPPLEPWQLLEVPLQTWIDPGGSKVTLGAMARSATDLVRIATDLQKRRNQTGR